MNIFSNIVFAWAYVIIVGGIMIIPEGPVPIVTVGIVSVVVGAVGLIANMRNRG